MQARISALEQSLEAETRLRLETGARLASEHMRAREPRGEPAQAGTGPDTNDRARAELETAWAQIHQLRAALERKSRRWWRRGRFSS